MEQTNVVDMSKMRVKIQISAKGDKYGEYSFRGDTEKELKDNGSLARQEFENHIKKWFQMASGQLCHLIKNKKWRRERGMKEQITNGMKYPELVELDFKKIWGELKWE